MKVLAASFVAVLGVAFVLSPHSALGQVPPPSATSTPTPTPSPTISPTPTSTPIPPTGKQLLALMKTAMSKVNSYHALEVLTLTIPKTLTISMSLAIDAIVKPAKLKGTATIQVSGPMASLAASSATNTTEKIVVVGKHTAARLDHKKWSCTSAKANAASSVSVLSNPTTAKLKKVTNAGPEVMDNVPVWHVTAVEKVSGVPGLTTAKKKTVSIPLNLYISQTDYTLVRIDLSLKTKSKGETIKEALSIDFSNYGETVSITLPKACKK